MAFDDTVAIGVRSGHGMAHAPARCPAARPALRRKDVFSRL